MGINEEAFQVLFVSVSVSDCKKYSQISDGLDAFGLSKVDLFLGLWAALIEKGLGLYSASGQVSGTSSAQ